jgi:putative membrane protein insertion efficiency factor
VCAATPPTDRSDRAAAEPPSATPPGVVAWLLLGLIRGYRLLLGPWLGGRCRFHPSCSQYGLLAIRKHGAWRGGWLTVWRILRCQPLSKGGIDFP